MAARLRVMVAPMKVGQSTERGLRFVKDKGALVSSLTEMDLGKGNQYISLARRVFGKGYRVLTDPSKGVHSEEIPIIIRMRPWVKIQDFRVWQISPDVGELGVGNDRYLARLIYRRWKTQHAVFAIHTNAGVQQLIPRGGRPSYEIFSNERWRVSVPAWQETEKRVGECIKDPQIKTVVLMGDVNVMPQGEGLTNPHSPYVVCKRLGMRYINERVTMLAYWGMNLQSSKVYPPGHAGWPSDHAAIVATFIPKG